jgi:hypothetical protein
MNTKVSPILIKKGFLQALGVTAYCGLVGMIFWRGNEIFGKDPNYAGPVAFLILFIVSALICASIVFYQPYKLFFENKKKEAIDLVIATTLWLFLFFILFLLSAIFF